MSDMDWSTPEGLAAIRAHLAERLDGWTPPVAWAAVSYTHLTLPTNREV